SCWRILPRQCRGSSATEGHRQRGDTPMTALSKPIPSWRDVLPIHPAAEMFPLMSPDELRALGEDISKNKLRVQVTVVLPDRSQPRDRSRRSDAIWWGAELLDGRNRLDAAEMVGIQVVGEDGHLLSDIVRFYWSDGIDPYAYVVSANIHRRHLTVEQ